MTKQYAIFNADNTLMTRFVSGINDISEGAIEVDEALWLRLTQETDGVWTLQADGSITKEPFPIASLESQKTKAWEAIKTERDRRTLAGANVGGQWVDSDVVSRSQWLGLKDNARDALVAGGAMADGLCDSEGRAVVWKMLDGSFVAVTAQLAFDVVAAVTHSDIAVFTAAEIHNATMLAAADPASYDYSTDWPQSYAEWAAAQVAE